MVRRLLVVTICTFACSGGSTTISPDADVIGDPDPDAGMPPSGFPRACEEIYDPELLPTFEVTISDVEWAGLVDEFMNWAEREAQGLDTKPYHPLESFRYGDEVVGDAMIRLKGNPCCSWFGPKMQFVISFNEIDQEGRWHGLRKIALDAPPYDPSYLRNRVALAYLRDLGLPASCANNARLVVNGSYYGLYTSIEHMDREFLERSFAEPDGDLWKYGWELKTNEDMPDTTRRDAWWGAGDVATLESLGDLGAIVDEWSAEAMIPHADGYFAGSGNFYVYDHPSRGFLFIPWDLDYTFDAAPIDADPITYRAPWGGSTPHFDLVLSDPDWYSAYLASLGEAVAAYDAPKLEEWVTTWSAQIADAAATDPTRPFTIEDHQWAVGVLHDYFAPRAEFVTTWLACAEGDGVDADGDGAVWCEDCNDGDMTIHPGAVEACDGIDQDCSGIADDTPDCPDCTMQSGGFWSCTLPRTWFAAQQNCTDLGGTLGVPIDASEQSIVVGIVATWAGVGDEWWIGANDLGAEGTFTDPSGTALVYTSWAPDRPNGADTQNCVVAQNSLGGSWNNRECEAERPSICRLP